MQFTKKIDIRRPDIWDFAYGGRSYHPSIEGAKSLIGSLNYVEKDGVTLGDSEGFIGNSYDDIVTMTGEQMVLAEDDDLYDTEFAPIDYGDEAHTMSLEPAEVQLQHWLRELEHVEFSIRWAYQKICEGGLFQVGRPGVSHSIWLRSYWKYYLKKKREVDRKIQSLILYKIINIGR